MDEFSALLSQFEEPEEITKIESEKPTVLIVDDDESMRRGVSRTLSIKYNVISASSGQDGINLFEENAVYAAVLDIKMPGMSGFEVCQELNKRNPDLPIIFYTAFQGEHDLQSILNIYRPFAYLDKGGDYDLPETVQDAVDKYSQIVERLQHQKEIEEKVVDLGLPLKDPKSSELVNIPNIIGKDKIKYYDNEKIDIKDFNTQEILGYMPDLSDEEVDRALSECRKQLDWWRRLTVVERLGIIAKAGKLLLDNDSLDSVIPKSGWFSKKVSVEPDRILTAKWMQKSVEYMSWAFGEDRVQNDIIEGIGTVGIIIQSSMFQTGAYGIIDALRAGNSVLVKLDSRDPYPEYLVGSVLQKAGAPVQIISVDTRKKPHIGRKLIDGLDKVVFMGNPYKVIEIAYGEAIAQLGTNGGIANDDISALKKKLLIPAKVISYTAHIGGGYIDKDASVEQAVDDCIYSSISHYRSCKRLKVLTIHPDLYDDALDLLIKGYSQLSVGKTVDSDVDVVMPSKIFWDKFIKPYLKEIPKFGKVVYGADKAPLPKIIEIDPVKLTQSDEIKGFLGTECMFPHLVVIKGDEKVAIYATKLMAENSHDGMLLEYAVFTNNDSVFRFIEKHGYSFNYHLNEPTTWGLGNPDENKFRFHQRRILAMDLAGTRVG